LADVVTPNGALSLTGSRERKSLVAAGDKRHFFVQNTTLTLSRLIIVGRYFQSGHHGGGQSQARNAGGIVVVSGTLSIINSVFMDNTVLEYGRSSNNEIATTTTDVATTTHHTETTTRAPTTTTTNHTGSTNHTNATSNHTNTTTNHTYTTTNTETTTAKGRSPEHGGAIASFGAVVQIENSSFLSNRGVNGGAVLLHDSVAEINSSVFQDNAATAGAGLYMNGSTATVRASYFLHNIAANGAAMFVTQNASLLQLVDSFVHSNAASGFGDFVFAAYGATIKVLGTSVTRNNGSSTVYSKAGSGNMFPVFYFVNSRIKNNSGMPFLHNGPSTGHGVKNCNADPCGQFKPGGFCTNKKLNYSGVVCIWGSGTFPELEEDISLSAPIKVTANLEISGVAPTGSNKNVQLTKFVSQGEGHRLFEVGVGKSLGLKYVNLTGADVSKLSGDAANGGAVVIDQGASLSVTGCVFHGNKAKMGGALYVRGTNSTNGRRSRRLLAGTSISLVSIVITSNTVVSGGKGGGLYVGSGTKLYVEGGRFVSNVGTDGTTYGGGCFCAAGSVCKFSKGIVIQSNTAGRGAGVYVSGASEFRNATIVGNTALVGGGAIYVDGATVWLADTTLFQNTAKKRGGAVRTEGKVDDPTYVYMTRINATENKQLDNGEYTGGAGMFIAGTSNAEIRESTFVNNNASYNRGHQIMTSSNPEIKIINTKFSSTDKGSEFMGCSASGSSVAKYAKTKGCSPYMCVTAPFTGTCTDRKTNPSYGVLCQYSESKMCPSGYYSSGVTDETLPPPFYRSDFSCKVCNRSIFLEAEDQRNTYPMKCIKHWISLAHPVPNKTSTIKNNAYTTLSSKASELAAVTGLLITLLVLIIMLLVEFLYRRKVHLHLKKCGSEQNKIELQRAKETAKVCASTCSRHANRLAEYVKRCAEHSFRKCKDLSQRDDVQKCVRKISEAVLIAIEKIKEVATKCHDRYVRASEQNIDRGDLEMAKVGKKFVDDNEDQLEEKSEDDASSSVYEEDDSESEDEDAPKQEGAPPPPHTSFLLPNMI
jgi:predicted outer membrane repeat protein